MSANNYCKVSSWFQCITTRSLLCATSHTLDSFFHFTNTQLELLPSEIIGIISGNQWINRVLVLKQKTNKQKHNDI